MRQFSVPFSRKIDLAKVQAGLATTCLQRSDFARMRRNAGSLLVTPWPKAKPPMTEPPPNIRER